VNTACDIFVGLTSADGYKTMLSHLGPDPKVGDVVFFFLLKLMM